MREKTETESFTPHLLALTLALSACASAPPRSAESPCLEGKGTVALGFEHATVGDNELPIGFFCGPRADQPTTGVTHISVSFAPQVSPEREVVSGAVVYRPAARVLDGEHAAHLSFDYVVKVTLRSAGNWMMELHYDAPWSTQRVTTTLLVQVKEPAAAPVSASR
jgi:hypothetical protein